MEEKNIIIKLTEDDLAKINGGTAITKDDLDSGLSVSISAVIPRGKTDPGGNEDVFSPKNG